MQSPFHIPHIVNIMYHTIFLHFMQSGDPKTLFCNIDAPCIEDAFLFAAGYLTTKKADHSLDLLFCASGVIPLPHPL